MTEPRYFNGLKQRWHSPRIHIEIVTRDDPSLSSPDHVLRTLDRFAREYRLRDGDQLWLLIDRDSQTWKPRTMASIARGCKQKTYYLAVSNPCFEIWLLLHFEDVPNQGAQRKLELIQNADGLLKSRVKRHCSTKHEYIDNFIPHTDVAIRRAKALDAKPQDRWPAQLGTRVYRLVEHLRPARN